MASTRQQKRYIFRIKYTHAYFETECAYLRKILTKFGAISLLIIIIINIFITVIIYVWPINNFFSLLSFDNQLYYLMLAQPYMDSYCNAGSLSAIFDKLKWVMLV